MSLVTFKGWEGKWWKNIKPGRALADAALTVMPGAGVASTLGKRVGGKLIRKGVGKLGRYFRSHHGRPGGHIGSKVTRGPLKLGKTKLMGPARPGLSLAGLKRLNMAVAAGGGAAAAVGVGKVVRPGGAVSAAHGSSSSTRPLGSSSTSPSSVLRRGSLTQPTKRCGCPAGQRMLCFKRRHNPDAIAKRKARRKAARAKSKAKTAKRHAKEKAAIARRKRSRALKRAKRLVRGKRGKGRRR